MQWLSNTQNVGNRFTSGFFINLGIANGPDNPPPSVDISGLPEFTFTCTAPKVPTNCTVGDTIKVTDPGRALITGNWNDIGRFKVPILRGLAARAPYFHNGGAATLLDVVNFYDAHFGIGFTDQQKQDLVNFPKAL